MTATSSLGSEHEEHLCFVLQERDIPCRRLSSVEQLPGARSHSQVLQLGTHTMMVMTGGDVDVENEEEDEADDGGHVEDDGDDDGGARG